MNSIQLLNLDTHIDDIILQTKHIQIDSSDLAWRYKHSKQHHSSDHSDEHAHDEIIFDEQSAPFNDGNCVTLEVEIIQLIRDYY